MIPPKLKPGDHIRVIAPSRSLSMGWLTPELQALARQRLEDLGFTLSFGTHVHEIDEFDSSTIESRIEDLHEAFRDRSVDGILTVIGGYNSNQLLDHIDYDLIKDNPKVLCGYSDITALANAIYAKTGVVTYSGPHFTTHFRHTCYPYIKEYFEKCCMREEPFQVTPALTCANGRYAPAYPEEPNEGWWVIQEGEVRGTLLGGNLCTFNLLQGTQYMPSLDGAIMMVEDDNESSICTFDRDLQSLVHQPGFAGVKGLVIGRFQPDTQMTRETLARIITSKQGLAGLPVVANVDFGHTTPMITFPIGGEARLHASESSGFEILTH